MTIEDQVRQSAEKFLQRTFIQIGMDRPENFREILDFITEDVMETSAAESEGFFSEGDIIIGFRRFIERER